MKGIFKMVLIKKENIYKEEISDKLESNTQLGQLSIKRLFLLQRLELDRLSHFITNYGIYDKNDIFKIVQEIIAANMVILKKINEKEIN